MNFCGRVKIIFQHSEDTQPGGAEESVAKGTMDDVDARSRAMYFQMKTLKSMACV